MFRKKESEDPRIPPGQRLTRGWPVLHASPIPKFNPDLWTFRVWGLVKKEIEWSWREFSELPRVNVHADFHCVTGWSKLDNDWEGVSFRHIMELAGVGPQAQHCLIYAPYGYTANVPLEILDDDDVLFSFTHDGEPLTAEHGGPLRLIVPKRYAWKSVKWSNGVQFLENDSRGYWEERGYHNRAEPFAEERYSWQE